MRTVLVCVRSSPVARDVAAMAARFGLTAVVRTATSEPEVMLRLSERPAEIVLADVSVTRSDPADFTRRVLARAPEAVLLIFGPTGHPSAAALAAGARGVLHSGDHDAACLVAKALMLLNAPARGRPTRPLTDNGRPEPAGGGQPDLGSRVVPAQRDVDPAPADTDTGDGDGDGDERATPAEPRSAEHDGRPAPARLPGPSAVRPGQPGPRTTDGSPGQRPRTTDGSPGQRPRLVLTERESQVLRAMADGKSNSEIGRELYVSEDTVKTHARRLFRKLGARDRAHAVAAGFRAGLVA